MPKKPTKQPINEIKGGGGHPTVGTLVFIFSNPLEEMVNSL